MYVLHIFVNVKFEFLSEINKYNAYEIEQFLQKKIVKLYT